MCTPFTAAGTPPASSLPSEPGREPVLVAFDRDIADREERDVSLFTWGTDDARALQETLTQMTDSGDSTV